MLVVIPPASLAQQTARASRYPATGHFTTTVYGGTPYSLQIEELRGGVDVLIATPGRLMDLMARGVVDLSLHLRRSCWTRPTACWTWALPDGRHHRGGDAGKARRFVLGHHRPLHRDQVDAMLNDPAMVQIAAKGETANTVEQFIAPIKNYDKPDLLQAVLRERGSTRVIVFARTKNRTEDCCR